MERVGYGRRGGERKGERKRTVKGHLHILSHVRCVLLLDLSIPLSSDALKFAILLQLSDHCPCLNKKNKCVSL